MKKIILLLSFVLVVLMSYFIWSKLDQVNQKSNKILAYVPQNSETIVVVENVNKTLLKLEDNITIWRELEKDKDFVSCRNVYNLAQSVFNFSEEKPCVFSAQPNGVEQDWLMISSNSRRKNDQTSSVKKFKDIEYDEFVVGKVKLYYFSLDNVQYYSTSMLAIQDAMSAMFNDTYFNYVDNEIKIRPLSGSDFSVLKKEKNENNWQEIDGFIRQNQIDFISDVNVESVDTLRLWKKLPESYLAICKFLPYGIESGSVLSGEYIEILTNNSVSTMLLGINKSLKYDAISDDIQYDSLDFRQFQISKHTLQKLLKDSVNIDFFKDTIYGIEDVDFALFSFSKVGLDSIYFDLKKNENIGGEYQQEELHTFVRKQWSEDVVLEEKQFISSNNLALRKVVLKPVESQTVRQEKYTWQVSFANKITQLHSVKNHRSGNVETLVQDSQHVLKLVSSSGKIKWETQLEDQIIGDVTQIDAFKNGKLQILFNTKSKIYLLDILGRYVDGFPVNLPSEATNSIAALDYEKTRDYRLLVATKKGVLNYNIEGKWVKGFAFNQSGLNVKGSIKHTVLGGNDYLLFNDKKGQLYFLNRKGKERHQSNTHLVHEDAFEFLRTSKTIASSSIYGLNEQGFLSEYTLGSEGNFSVKDSTVLKALYKSHSNKKYIVGVADRAVYLYTRSGNLLREISCDFEPIKVVSSIKTTQDGLLLIQSKSNVLYLYNLYTDTFVEAINAVSVVPLIKNINGEKEVLVVQNGKNLRAYPIK